MKSNDIKRQAGLVRIRGGFSDVQGIAPCNTMIQTTEFDNDTRMTLSNRISALLEYYFEGPGAYDQFGGYKGGNYQESFCKAILNEVFHQRNDKQHGYDYNWRRIYEEIHKIIIIAVYNEVLDIVGYCCKWVTNQFDIGDAVYEFINGVFQREYVGYRFLNGQIVPITDENELSSIEDACKNPIDGCRKQIQKAVAFLADRQNPDYKNCIKESISAVESICQVIVGDEKATLGDALKKLEDAGVQIHPAMKQAFQKLYGYTSDQGGIRHAEGMFESNVTFEEAKFMLVSCSTFINYLIAEYGKRGNGQKTFLHAKSDIRLSGQPIDSFIKLNAYKAEGCPLCNVFETDITSWAELRSIIGGHDIIAGLYNKHIYAFSSAEKLGMVFQKHILSLISTAEAPDQDIQRNESVYLGLIYQLIKQSLITKGMVSCGKYKVYNCCCETISKF